MKNPVKMTDAYGAEKAQGTVDVQLEADAGMARNGGDKSSILLALHSMPMVKFSNVHSASAVLSLCARQ